MDTNTELELTRAVGGRMGRAKIKQFVPLLEQEMMRCGGDEGFGQLPQEELHEPGGGGDVDADLLQIHSSALLVLQAEFLQSFAVAVDAK